MTQELKQRSNVKAWFDLQQENLTPETMKEGVRQSRCFVLCASLGYSKSWYCQLELIEALTLNKPIVVLYDGVHIHSWSITVTELDSFLDETFVNIQKHEYCTATVKELDLASFKAKVISVPFALKVGSPNRDSMLTKILNTASWSLKVLPPLPLKVEDLSQVDIFIVGHRVFGADQCELISLGLAGNGIRSVVLDTVEDVMSAFQHLARSRNSLVVFLTDKVFDEAHVVQAVKMSKARHMAVLGVFEADFAKDGSQMRGGRWDPQALRSQTDDSTLTSVLDQDCLSFTQYDRKMDEFQSLISEMASKVGFETLFASVDNQPSLWWASGKARELEEGTREWSFTAAQQIVLNKPCCILIAGAGMGKSCIMGTMAMRHYSSLARMSGSTTDNSNFEVGGIHFFQYADPTQRKIETCVLSLSRQLCASVPGFRRCLPKIETDDGKVNIRAGIKMILDNANVLRPHDRSVALLRELVVKPCRRLEGSPFGNRKCVLLVDALDECEDSNAMTNAIQALWSTSVDDIRADQAPEWLVMMASTRPESIAQVRFQNFDQVKLEPDEKQNREDLRLFITNRIHRWNTQPDDSNLLREAILKQSEDVFLWLAYQEKALKKLAMDHKLTTNSIEDLPKGLTKVYVDFFTRIQDELDSLLDKLKMEYKSMFRDIGESDSRFKDLYYVSLTLALVAPRAPIPESLWRNCLGLKLTSRVDDLIYLHIKSELTKLLIFDSSLGIIRAPHKTMVDFLDQRVTSAGGDDPKVHKLKLEAQPEHHERIGRTMLNVVDALDGNEFGSYNEEQLFCLRHVVYHCTLAEMYQESMACYLNLERLMRVIDAARLDSDVSRVVTEGDHLLGAIPSSLPRVASARLEPFLPPAEASTKQTPELRKSYKSIETDPSRLKYCLQVLDLAQDALSIDARMLPGQILGRVGAPPFDQDQQYFIHAARSWLDTNKKREGPNIAEPLHFGMSGLDFAGSSLVKTFTFDDSVKSVCYGNNDEICAAAGYKAFVYNRQTGRQLQVFQGHSSWVDSVAISTNKKWIVTGSNDKTARIWSLNSGKQEHVLEGHSSRVRSVAISNDSEWIVTGSYGDARIWNLKSGKQEHVLEGHSNWVSSLAISTDSKWIVTGSDDKTARIWNLNSGKQEHVLEGHSSRVNSVAISTDSKWIVTGSNDNTVRIWNLNSGKQEHVLEGHSDGVNSVAISTDSKWIVTGSSDNTARVWNLNSGKQEHVLEGHSNWVTSVALSTDSKWIVTGSYDNTARIWNSSSGKQEHVLVGHSSGMTSVAISTDSKWIVTGSYDKTARIWNLNSGKQEHVVEGHSRVVTSIAISNDSKWIMTRSYDGATKGWSIEDGSQLSEKEATDIFSKDDDWSSIRPAAQGSNPRYILGLQAKDVGVFVDPSADIGEIMRLGSHVFFRCKNSFGCWKLD